MQRKIAIIGSLFLLLGTIWSAFVINRLTPPEAPKDTVTIPEGWSVREINAFLKSEGVLEEEELRPDLEGYLFPDTYEFFLGSSVEVVEDRFISNLERKLSSLGISLEDENLTEILTLASLIQEEIIDHQEMRVAAGVMVSRMEAGIPLQVDATLCYIKEARGKECLPITDADKALDSPYNTYLYRGLPPGPISNPGLDAIKAALNPANSPYLYYISDPRTGRTIFAKTLDEHNQNVIKYLSE